MCRKTLGIVHMHIFGEALLATMAIMTMYDFTGRIYRSSRVNSTVHILSIPSFSTLSGYSYIHNSMQSTPMAPIEIRGTARPTAHFPPREFRRV